MSTDLRVGGFVVVTVGILVYMTSYLLEHRSAVGKALPYYALVNDAAGLVRNSRVKIAGIDVGQLRGMELKGTKAKVSFEVREDQQIHEDATIAIRWIGFLGDKYLELDPGSEKAPVLPAGGTLQEKRIGTTEQTLSKASDLIDNLNALTLALRQAVEGNGLREQTSRFESIIANIERFSQQLAQVQGLGSLAKNAEVAARNLEEITGRIRRGEGTLGELVYKNDVADELKTSMSSVSRITSEIQDFQASLAVRTELLTHQNNTLSEFLVRLAPNPGMYALLGASVRPQGVTAQQQVINPTSLAIQYVPITTGTAAQFEAQFAKRWGEATLRLGLFEGTGGAALDYGLVPDHLKLSAEVYRFSQNNGPQFNVEAEARIFRLFFLSAGGDYLSSPDNRSFFLGAGFEVPLVGSGFPH